jgi:hypothetical protein
MRNTPDLTGGKLIAIWSQFISGVSADNPLIAFYDIHNKKERDAIHLFCSGILNFYVTFNPLLMRILHFHTKTAKQDQRGRDVEKYSGTKYKLVSSNTTRPTFATNACLV